MAAKAKTYDLEFLKKLYFELCYYRRFEERVLQAYTAQKFAGFCHVHIGQEALCVGVQRALKDTDYMISAYRSHTQAIAKGIPGNEVFAELFGRYTGCAKGNGGSMHMFSKDRRFLGGHGIVGGQVPLAAGVGFAINYEKKDEIIVCYMGDAATNQGQFHEALNMAATWSLPCLFIVENNRYGMGTDIKRTTSVDHLWKRALAYDMDHGEVDGMNVLTTMETVTEIVAKIRKTKRPYFLDAICYRYKGHSVSDPGLYRTKEEMAEWLGRDPILQLGEYIKKQKLMNDAELKAVDTEAKAKARADEEWADEQPIPPEDAVWRYVYAD
ncbi:MAG: pyruvate dehydrogenase (acetyl-transferring) E1 component subunit alpha [Proteobacteria bacterium]|nr:pyruvate dehydrogenase (acetyl-transferring) E1 component subunit alpha [Pseudomonadota bacterium]